MKAVQNVEPQSLVGTASPGLVANTLLEPAVHVTLPAVEPGNDSDLVNELAVAHAIQQSLLPKEFPPLPGFGLAAFCHSARHVGGDFYDVLPLGKSRVLVVIADVMGKGVPAALFAASLRMLVRSFAEFRLRPCELLKRINRQMFEELSSVDMFITGQAVLIDAERRLLQVASAGHCPLLLANRWGNVEAIAPDGLPLGIDPCGEYAEQTAVLPSGACLLLYTDGLTDASNPGGHSFGQERLKSWLAQNGSLNRSAVQAKEDFLADLRRFQLETAAPDDMTLVLVAEEPIRPVSEPAENIWTAQE